MLPVHNSCIDHPHFTHADCFFPLILWHVRYGGGHLPASYEETVDRAESVSHLSLK